MSSASIQVKCYLKSGGMRSPQTEIRRFVLTTNGWNGSYEQLLKRIQAAFSLDDQELKKKSLYWEDDETEMVGFSSDDEMKYAIEVLTTVHLTKNKGESQAPFVFKVYIKNEKSTPINNGNNNCGNNIHCGVVCDGCEGSIVGSRFKCLQCHDYDLCEKCEEKGVHKETAHKFDEIKTPLIRNSYCRSGMFGPRCQRAKQHWQQHKKHHNGNHNPFTSFLSSFGQNISSLPPASEEELKKFGENLKSFITPFGIDLDYYVETKDKPSTTTKTTTTTTTKTDNKEESEKPKTSTEEKKETEMETDEKSESNETKTETAAATATAPSEDQGKSPYKDVFDLMKSFDVIGSLSPNESDSTTIKKSAQNLASSIINSSRPVSETASASASTSTDNINIEREMKIINAIEHLKAMGYKDEDGWLTRLAVTKNGNINDILDVITPKI